MCTWLSQEPCEKKAKGVKKPTAEALSDYFVVIPEGMNLIIIKIRVIL